MMYSFGLVTYNQERNVVRALESIKYQIVTFGEYNTFEVIVADDGSIDNTVNLAKRWLDENKSLFDNRVVISAEKNEGTCKNICKLYKAVTGSKLLCFAADDAIAHNNILEYIDLLDGYDLVNACYVAYSGNKVITDRSSYLSLLQRSYQKRNQLELLSVARVPIDGPTMIFKTGFLGEELFDDILKCKLIEDRPTIYHLLRQHDIKYCFDRNVRMLYQVTDKSVSHDKNGKTYQTCLKDLSNFYEHCLKNDKSLLIRFVALCNYKRFNNKKIFKYINFPYYFLLVNDFLHRKTANRTMEYILSEIEAGQRHLDFLNKQAAVFMNEKFNPPAMLGRIM